MSFIQKLKVGVPPGQISRIGRLSYITAATAVQIAGRPGWACVDFGRAPYLAAPALTGALVAVDMPVGKSVQRTWLPVMDRNYQPIPVAGLTTEIVHCSMQRAIVKSMAMVTGAGMSVFLDCDGESAVTRLAVNPASNLAEVPPVVSTLPDGQEYLSWAHAVAACRITDPDFVWEVAMWDGNPYREVLGGLVVDVTTSYKGATLRLSLPVAAAGAVATVTEWNKAVMRCLAKCISFNSGYGLSIYQRAFDEKVVGDTAPVAKPRALVPGNVVPGWTKEKVIEPPEASAVGPVDCITRFTGVMQKRSKAKGPQGVVALFSDLAASANYTAAEKAICLGVLVPAAVSVAQSGELIQRLLEEIHTYRAMENVAPDARGAVAGRLIATTLAVMGGQDDESLLRAADKLVAAGIVGTLSEVARLATPAATKQLLESIIAA